MGYRHHIEQIEMVLHVMRSFTEVPRRPVYNDLRLTGAAGACLQSDKSRSNSFRPGIRKQSVRNRSPAPRRQHPACSTSPRSCWASLAATCSTLKPGARLEQVAVEALGQPQGVHHEFEGQVGCRHRAHDAGAVRP